MNLQRFFDNEIQSARARQMQNSDQLTLGQLIEQLEEVKNKDLPIVFDRGEKQEMEDNAYSPEDLISWRGSYAEVSISFSEDEKMLTKTLLDKCHKTIGKCLQGYKGGIFYMDQSTPIWVANYGSDQGFNETTQGVIGIEEGDEKVVIKTEKIQYL